MYNEYMSAEQKKILIGAVAVVVLLIVAGLVSRARMQKPSPAGIAPAPIQEAAGGDAPAAAFSKEVPKNIEITQPENRVVFQSGSGGEEALSEYEITASPAGYAPNRIVVREKDIVTLRLKSSGGRFDIYSPAMGFYLDSKDGETVHTRFRTLGSGTYLFECRDFCPAGKKVQGTMVVKPSE